MLKFFVNGSTDPRAILRTLSKWSQKKETIYEISLINVNHLSYEDISEICKTIKLLSLKIKINVFKTLDIKQLLLLSSAKRVDRKLVKNSYLKLENKDLTGELKDILDAADEIDFFEKETNFTEKKLKELISKKSSVDNEKLNEYMKMSSKAFVKKYLKPAPNKNTPNPVVSTTELSENENQHAQNEITPETENQPEANNNSQTVENKQDLKKTLNSASKDVKNANNQMEKVLKILGNNETVNNETKKEEIVTV